MSKFNIPQMNSLDRIVSFISPASGLKRMESKIRLEVLNTLQPLKTNRRGNAPMPGNVTSEETLIPYNDRSQMIKLARIMSRENPILDGMLERMVNNVIPTDGILPNAITDDIRWNSDAEEYYAEKSEICDITRRYSLDDFQRVLLHSVLRDGDFFTIFTNKGVIQGVESDRVQTPANMYNQEDKTIIQGVNIDLDGAPEKYYVGRLDKYGNAIAADFYTVPAWSVEHSFVPERVSQYRGVCAFLSALDHLRDMHDILNYEKFVIKMCSAIGLKFKPPEAGGSTSSLPLPGTEETNTETGRTQVISEMFPGMMLNLRDMGVGDVEVLESKRPGTNFNSMLEMLARMAGCGVGLPIELVLLDFHRGNMSSVRAAMMEARKVFMSHYKTIKRFTKRHYRWTIWQGIMNGDIKPPSSVKNPYKAEYSEPVWNYLDPLNELEADAMAIVYGFQTFADVAKRKGKDKAEVAKILSHEWQMWRDAKVPIAIGQPGTKTIQDHDRESAQPGQDAKQKTLNKDNNK